MSSRISDDLVAWFSLVEGSLQRRRADAIIGPLVAMTAQFAFATKGIFVKSAYAISPVDGTTLLTMRMLYAAPFHVGLALWVHRRVRPGPLTRRDWLMLLVLGSIGYYLSSLLGFLGLQTISVALERLVLFLYPTIVLLMSAVVQRRAIRLIEAAAVALSYGGILLVFLHDLAHAQNTRGLAVGVALVFGSSFLYSVYLVWGHGVIARVGATRFTAYAMLVSTAGISTQFAVTHSASALSLPARVHVLALCMAVFATVLPTWLVSQALARMPASRVAVIGSVGPIATIWMGHVVLGDPVGLMQLLGTTLVLGGVLLVTLRGEWRIRRVPERSSTDVK